MRTFGGLGGIALARTAALLAGALVVSAATGVSFAVQDVAMTTADRTPELLRIDGSISGVVPGAPSAALTLTLTNAGDAPRHVTSVRADSTGVAEGPAHCDGDWLTVGEWDGHVRVPAHGTATVAVPVAVSAALPAGCATVVWELLYTAR